MNQDENIIVRAIRDVLERIFPAETYVFEADKTPRTGPGFDQPMLQPKGEPITDRQVAAMVQSPVKKDKTLKDQISQGLEKSGFGKAPIASELDAFVEAGEMLGERGVDPLLPVIVALMESGGGANVKDPGANNPFNIFKPGTENPAQYANFRESLFGPEGSGETLNLMGLLREGGLYQDFIDSGDVSMFFDRFTPGSDPRNPSNKELVERFNKLKSNF